jgi:hypothetical protein
MQSKFSRVYPPRNSTKTPETRRNINFGPYQPISISRSPPFQTIQSSLLSSTGFISLRSAWPDSATLLHKVGPDLLTIIYLERRRNRPRTLLTPGIKPTKMIILSSNRKQSDQRCTSFFRVPHIPFIFIKSKRVFLLYRKRHLDG